MTRHRNDIISNGDGHDNNPGHYLSTDDVSLESHDMTKLTGMDFNVSGDKAKHLKITEVEETKDTRRKAHFSPMTITPDVH